MLTIDLGALFEVTEVIIGRELSQGAAAPSSIKIAYNVDGTEEVEVGLWQNLDFVTSNDDETLSFTFDVVVTRYVVISALAGGDEQIGFRWDVIGCPYAGQ